MRLAYLFAPLVFVACSSDPVTTGPAPAPSSSAPTAVPSTCAGACLTTALTGSSSGAAFSRAQFGRDAGGLYVEMHEGGAAECPGQSSATPSRTIVLSGLPLFESTEPLTTATASLIDFDGKLLAKLTPAKATAVRVTPVARTKDLFATPEQGFVAFDFAATFEVDAGPVTVTGHVYALYCASLDAD